MREPTAATDVVDELSTTKETLKSGQQPQLFEADPSAFPVWYERFAPVLVLLVILLGFAIRLTGLKWGQAYSYFGQSDAVEAYRVAINYGQGEARAQYLG